jgi:3-dehydroquinate dehydratase I
MICVSLSEPTLAGCLAALADLPFAEIRLDKMRLSTDDVRTLFSSHKRLIATHRPGEVPDEERGRLLMAAIGAGAAYVDVEVEAGTAYREEIVAKAHAMGCTVIVSFHDHERTPGRSELEARLSECFGAGADIAKIACTARTDRDNARLLGLLDEDRRVVVVGMGAIGRITRVLAPMLGSPFTFASLGKGRETAEGQMDRTTLEGLIEMVRKKTDAEGEERS